MSGPIHGRRRSSRTAAVRLPVLVPLAPALNLTLACGPASSASEQVAQANPSVATNIALIIDPPQAKAGVAQVKLANIPPGAFLAPQSSQQAAPINQIPINQIPINQIAENAPINQIPINQIPINQIPINQIDSGFAAFTQQIEELGDIQLASIPLTREGGWEAVLAGTTLDGLPLQSVTLRDVYALVPPPEPLQAGAAHPLELGELDLSRS